MPLVSFIVTSFNYENYVIKTLDSIKAQTYKNFEIIVVDDASTDDSVSLLENYPDITLIKHAENKGQLAAFQTGLAAANGQFVCFIDSDDVLIKDYAKTLIRVHLSTSVAFASCQIIEIGENDEIHTTASVSSFQKVTELKSLENLLDVDVENVDFKVITTKEAPFGGWWWSPSSSAMFRKSAIEMILKYDTPENWKVCPDKFLFNFAHLIGGSALVYAPLVGYRRHGKNAGHSNTVCGNTRYNNDITTELNIENNKKIRKDTIKFIKSHRAEFNEQFGKNNVSKMILRVVLSYGNIFNQVKNFVFK